MIPCSILCNHLPLLKDSFEPGFFGNTKNFQVLIACFGSIVIHNTSMKKSKTYHGYSWFKHNSIKKERTFLYASKNLWEQFVLLVNIQYSTRIHIPKWHLWGRHFCLYTVQHKLPRCFKLSYSTVENVQHFLSVNFRARIFWKKIRNYDKKCRHLLTKVW